MARIMTVISALLISFASVTCGARDFFVGVNTEGNNAWAIPIQIPAYVINSALGGGASSNGYSWLHVSNRAGDVKIDRGNWIGFKAKDIFNQFGLGLQIGYQPKYSVFGAWINGNYRFRQFRMQIDPATESMDKYQIPSWNVGVGIRFSPFVSNLEDNGWCPFIDFGTIYESPFAIKAPYGNDPEQLGKGMRLNVGIGVRLEESGINISISGTRSMYTYFNRNFQTPEGLKPYEFINSREFGISLKIQREF